MVLAPIVAASMGIAAGGGTAGAAGAEVDKVSFSERCATRLSISFLGKSATTELLTSPDPKTAIEQMVTNPDFFERFARFANSEFNDNPGDAAKPAEDASYFLSKQILTTGKPWSDLFVGQYKVDAPADKAQQVAVTEDANGLGYFRSMPWLLRYAGNEEKGIKLSTAYRIMNNTVGLKLVASTNAPDADVSATGRQGGVCKGCHYTNWFALDHVASVLSTKVKNGNNVAFTDYKGGPKDLLGGKQIGNDKELVQALVDSENFSFNACRLAFKYLYGRVENKCEGPVMDRCIDNFKATKTMQSALISIAKEPGFCQ